MADLWDNPMGTDGFEFVEYTGPEPAQSQIAEYLSAYHGEGIQHIALATADIYRAVEALRARDVAFTAVPQTYYAAVERKGNEGFGEGNFRALFESIEADQIRHGVLTAPEPRSDREAALQTKSGRSGARPKAASPEPIFQRPVFMGSGLAAARHPGMTGFLKGGRVSAPAIRGSRRR